MDLFSQQIYYFMFVLILGLLPLRTMLNNMTIKTEEDCNNYYLLQL